MRYFLKINISGSPIEKAKMHNEKLEGFLPIKKIHLTSKSVFLKTFSYEINDLSIINANWDLPFYENNTYFLFIGGFVLNRLSVVNTNKKVYPSPQEVLNILIEKKDEHFKFLKGSYYLLLLDKNEKKITIYSSPMFLYPVFFIIESDTFIFSNILEFILKTKESIQINEKGLVEFSLFDHQIGMDTIYKDVYSPSGGTRIDIKSGTFEEKKIYDIANWIHKKPRSRKDTLSEINNVLRNVINNYISKVKKFNISLTGGFDGRLNFAVINPADYPRLQAFSYGKSGSLQLSVPQKISNELGFNYKPVRLDKEFAEQYNTIGYDTIILSSGLTPFTRANYLYGYNRIKDFSRNCILGQCDMIRPLYTNPAGAIFNKYSRNIFYGQKFTDFYTNYEQLALNGFINHEFFTKEIADQIYDEIQARYIMDYLTFSSNEKYFLYLYKESMLKFWHTECHIVDLLVDDFISFSDLDFIEILSSSQYFGLYKGIFAKNQYQRRKAHDLYIDLMAINNDKLNYIITDRFFKPKWLKLGYFGYAIAAMGKQRAISRANRIGNDTYEENDWPNRFYNRFEYEIMQSSSFFNTKNFKNSPYTDDNKHRYDRAISLKLWFNYLGLR